MRYRFPPKDLILEKRLQVVLPSAGVLKLTGLPTITPTRPMTYDFTHFLIQQQTNSFKRTISTKIAKELRLSIAAFIYPMFISATLYHIFTWDKIDPLAFIFFRKTSAHSTGMKEEGNWNFPRNRSKEKLTSTAFQFSRASESIRTILKTIIKPGC